MTARSRGSRLWGAAGAGVLRRRWVARAPIWLFEVGLGSLFGGRLLMIEHTGRRTGRRRRVVLEVVDRPSSGRFLVASGFGAKSQWLRNIGANPSVRVWVASRRAVPATASLLPREDAAAALASYARRHPVAWVALRPIFETTLGAPAGQLPLVAVELLAADRNPASRGPAWSP